MKEIIKRENSKIELLLIEEKITLLDYLKNENSKFVLRTLSPRNFEELKNNEFSIELLDYFNWNFIADYGRVLGKPELFRLGANNLMGYYTMDNESIIYHPMKTKEYTRIFSGIEYFTQYDLSQLLYEELNQKEKRNLFLDLEENETFENMTYEQVNKDQLIEYALNPYVGKQLVKRIKK